MTSLWRPNSIIDMSTENRIHVRWDGRLYPEVDTADLRRFFATFGAVVEVERKNNRKKGKTVSLRSSNGEGILCFWMMGEWACGWATHVSISYAFHPYPRSLATTLSQIFLITHELLKDRWRMRWGRKPIINKTSKYYQKWKRKINSTPPAWNTLGRLRYTRNVSKN